MDYKTQLELARNQDTNHSVLIKIFDKYNFEDYEDELNPFDELGIALIKNRNLPLKNLSALAHLFPNEFFDNDYVQSYIFLNVSQFVDTAKWSMLPFDEVLKTGKAPLRLLDYLLNDDDFGETLFSNLGYYPQVKLDYKELEFERADLECSYLANMDLSNMKFSGVHAMKSNLSNCNLSNSDMRKADLDRANLSNANLTNTDLRGAKLCCANLTGANLTGTKLKGANLSGAILTNTNISIACFE